MRTLTIVALVVALYSAPLPISAECSAPTITATPPTTSSCGTPVMLDAGPGWASYTWTDANGTAVGNSQTLTTEITSTYTVSVTDANGCTSTASVPVSVSDWFIARAPQSACPSQVISNIEAVAYGAPTGSETYSWSMTHGSVVGQNGMHADVMLDGSGPAELSVTIDDGHGCIVTKSVTIQIAPPMTDATVSAAATTICAGDSTTVTAAVNGGSGSYGFQWYSYTDTVSTTAQTITVTPSVTSWYYARVTDNYGCGSTYTNAVQIVVNGTSADFTVPSASCENATATATAASSSTATYQWSIAGGTIEWGQGTPYMGFSVGSNGANVSLTVTDNGCTQARSKYVAALHTTTPTITASGPTTFCATDSVRLTSSPASTYRWSTGETTQSIVASTAADYTVTTGSTDGCEATAAPLRVTVLPRPSATVSGSQTICSGASAEIAASLTGTAPFSVTWNDGLVQTVATGTTATRSVSPSATTSYSVVSVADANGCSGTGSGTAVVTVRTPPSADVSGSATVCAGSPTTIVAALSLTDYPVTLTWSDGFVQQVTTGTTATRTVTPAATMTYSVVSVADRFCSGTASGSAAVTVDTAPVIASQPASVTIKRNSAATFSVAATSSRPMSYQWYRGVSGDTTAPVVGATSATYTTGRLSSTTSFWVRISSECGATDSATATAAIR